MKQYEDDELLNYIRNFQGKNGRPPMIKDFKENNTAPSIAIIKKRFGTWNNALNLAGLEINRVSSYTKEELIEYLHLYYERYGKVPTVRGMKNKGNYPSLKAYSNVFGTFKNALIESNLYKIRQDKYSFSKNKYSKEELIEITKDWITRTNKIPTKFEIENDKSLPSYPTYLSQFKSIKNLYKELNIQNKKDVTHLKIKNEIIEEYKKICTDIGKSATIRDIESYKGKFTPKQYNYYFDGLHEVQKLACVPFTKLGDTKTNDELISDLIKFYYKINRTPTHREISKNKNMASIRKYKDVFGSWENILRIANLKSNNKVYYSNKGIKCLSFYELLFTNMLEEYSIYFEKEEKYNEYIPIKNRYRFDFTLSYNKKYFVEIFGVSNNKNYELKTRNKIKICEKYNIPLIKIYPEDFKSWESKDLYSMLSNKISAINLKVSEAELIL